MKAPDSSSLRGARAAKRSAASSSEIKQRSARGRGLLPQPRRCPPDAQPAQKVALSVQSFDGLVLGCIDEAYSHHTLIIATNLIRTRLTRSRKPANAPKSNFVSFCRLRREAALPSAGLLHAAQIPRVRRRLPVARLAQPPKLSKISDMLYHPPAQISLNFRIFGYPPDNVDF